MLPTQLTNPDILKKILSQHGITPQRSAGQHFLICDEPIEAVIELVRGAPPAITELGAGVGPLTLALLSSGFHVRAIERDPALARVLAKTVPAKLRRQLDVVPQDLRETPWEWEEAYQIVGNIPYNLSGLIIRRLTKLEFAPHQAVLLVQQEVGQRLTAAPPHMSLLTLAVQLWGEAHQVLAVPADCFWPAPQVSSQLVLLVPHRPERAVPVLQREALLAFARPFFQAKRKQIGGTLKRTYKLTTKKGNTLLLDAGINATQRPQELSVKDWLGLYESCRA